MSPQKTSIGFLGTPIFADKILRQLLTIKALEISFVITQPDRPAGRGKRLTPSPVKQTALEHGIPLLQPESIKKEIDTVISFIAERGEINGAVVVAYGGLLPPRFLKAMHDRCINVHASLLPRWRGAAPIQRAIMAGDTKTGICLMKMEEGLDTGPVFSSQTIDINPHETAGSLHDRLCDAACDLISSDLLPILSGNVTPTPQDTEGIIYAAKISSAEAAIDWSEPAIVIERQIAGLSPHPGAFTGLYGQRLRILEAFAREKPTPEDYLPGEVLAASDMRVLEVITGDGILSATKVQLEGKQPMTVEAFRRGKTIPAKTKLEI
jgi:methionyl-tRNA formyltransferase